MHLRHAKSLKRNHYYKKLNIIFKIKFILHVDVSLNYWSFLEFYVLKVALKVLKDILSLNLTDVQASKQFLSQIFKEKKQEAYVPTLYLSQK